MADQYIVARCGHDPMDAYSARIDSDAADGIKRAMEYLTECYHLSPTVEWWVTEAPDAGMSRLSIPRGGTWVHGAGGVHAAHGRNLADATALLRIAESL